MLFKERQELKENAEFVLILINPLPLHQSPQFPINNGKFTLELFVTGRSKMLWSVVTSEGNKKIDLFSMVTSTASLKSTLISHPFTKRRSRSTEVEKLPVVYSLNSSM